MTVTAILLLIVLGILLLLVEFLVIPGITIAGIFGTLLVIGGVFCGYYYHQTPTGHYIMAGSLGTLIIIFSFAFKTKTWKRFGLQSSIDSKVGGIDEEKVNVGDEGKAISRLTPIGKAIINDEVFEVRTTGDVIDQNSDIIVYKIEGNKIIVKLKN